MSQFHETPPSNASQDQPVVDSMSPRGNATQHAHPTPAASPPPDRRVALVLGGGGAAGNAWEIGILAGLAAAGVDIATAANLVIGTSAGATAAAQIGSGQTMAELFAAIVSAPSRPTGAERTGAGLTGAELTGAKPAGAKPASMDQQPPPSLPMATVVERMRSINAEATSAADLQRAMGAFGLECDAVLGPGADQRRAIVATRLPRHEWPDRRTILVVADARTGEMVLFDRDSGVDLVDAVTASTALPGLVPVHRIDGVPYIDGGVRSAENADLAAGYGHVVVLAPLGGRADEPAGEAAGKPADDRTGRFEGLRRAPGWGTDLASQVETLRRNGSRVEVITPDADSQTAFGTNQMDPATRVPAARAGYAQGQHEAARVRLA